MVTPPLFLSGEAPESVGFGDEQIGDGLTECTGHSETGESLQQKAGQRASLHACSYMWGQHDDTQ